MNPDDIKNMHSDALYHAWRDNSSTSVFTHVLPVKSSKLVTKPTSTGPAPSQTQDQIVTRVTGAHTTKQIPDSVALNSNIALNMYRNQIVIFLHGHGNGSENDRKRMLMLPVEWLNQANCQGLWCMCDAYTLEHKVPQEMRLQVSFMFELAEDLKKFHTNFVMLNKLSN